MAEIERQTAVKCKISDLINGNYIVQEGWKPNYIDSAYGRVSRVNVLAVVVSKENVKQVFVDDGSGKVSVREFDSDKLADLEIGDVIMIIGRPRQFNNQIYLLPEIIKKIIEKRWVELRKLELDKRVKLKQEEKEHIEDSAGKIEAQKPLFNYSEKVLEKIKDLDKGEGAGIDDVISAVKFKEAEKTIMHLLEEGEIFEIRPGKVKVLE